MLFFVVVFGIELFFNFLFLFVAQFVAWIIWRAQIGFSSRYQRFLGTSNKYLTEQPQAVPVGIT